MAVLLQRETLVDDSTGKAGRCDEREERVRQILAYHSLSKHHAHRYAAGPDGLDWANQPDPFRTYVGAPAVDLLRVNV